MENECGTGGTLSTGGFDLVGDSEGNFSNDLEALKEIDDGLLNRVGSASVLLWGRRTLRGCRVRFRTVPFLVITGA